MNDCTNKGLLKNLKYKLMFGKSVYMAQAHETGQVGGAKLAKVFYDLIF